MARKTSSRKSTARSSATSRLKRLVPSLKSSASKRTVAAAPVVPATPASPHASLPPVKRVSVVRKPPRGPSIRATRTAAAIARSEGRSAKAAVRQAERRQRARTSSPQPPAAGEAAIPQPSFSSAPGSAPTPSWSSQPTSSTSAEQQFSIPTGYGDDRIALMVKDPWWLYAYWEIQPSTERAARSQLLPHEVAGLQSILRVYDVTGIEFPVQPAHRAFDIGLSGLATNWYIHTDAPNRSFIVDLGLLTNNGRFLLLARSNRVTAPRFGPSDVIDEQWMTTDDLYWKLFGLSAGLGMGSSPTAWAQLIPQQLFSGSVSSAGLVGPSRQSVIRGFWCRVNTDLVIHGATEPKSTVLIQGQPASVRKDGTFSLRMALPVGTQTITVDVTSPDGRTTRTVTPIVTLAWSGALSPETPSTKPPRSQQTSGPQDDRHRGIA